LVRARRPLRRPRLPRSALLQDRRQPRFLTLTFSA
jgi:hypothetical protein